MCRSQSIIASPFAKYYVPNVTAANKYTVSFKFLQFGPLQRIFFNQIDWVPLVGDAMLLEAQKGAEEGTFVQGGVTFYWPSSQFVVPISNAIVAQLVINSNSNDPHPFYLYVYPTLGSIPRLYTDWFVVTGMPFMLWELVLVYILSAKT
jgi:hypothetical protein